MLNFNFLSLIICIIGILLVTLPTEWTLVITKIKYKIIFMGNPFNPYNINSTITNEYSPYDTHSSGGYSGYNVPTHRSTT